MAVVVVVDVTITTAVAVATVGKIVILVVRSDLREVLMIFAVTVDVKVAALARRVVVLVVSQFERIRVDSMTSRHLTVVGSVVGKELLFHIFAAAFLPGANRPKIPRLFLGTYPASEATGVKPAGVGTVNVGMEPGGTAMTVVDVVIEVAVCVFVMVSVINEQQSSNHPRHQSG